MKTYNIKIKTAEGTSQFVSNSRNAKRLLIKYGGITCEVYNGYKLLSKAKYDICKDKYVYVK